MSEPEIEQAAPIPGDPGEPVNPAPPPAHHPVPARTDGKRGYTVIEQSRTVDYTEAGQLMDVEKVGFKTHPSNVYAQVLVPIDEWKAGRSGHYVAPVAHAIEHLIAAGYARSASLEEDVDPQTGRRATFIDFTVGLKHGHGSAAMTTTVRLPVTELAHGASGKPAEALQAAIAQLHKTAEL